eukprot:scaffold18363_cov105-Skeletonema_dohrnii-CCMP3373.AAC.2
MIIVGVIIEHVFRLRGMNAVAWDDISDGAGALEDLKKDTQAGGNSLRGRERTFALHWVVHLPYNICNRVANPGSFRTYRRRCNDVGDLMRPNFGRLPALLT